MVWTDFPDYDMLDSMIASVLERLLDKHVHFRKRVSVEEQRVQKYDRPSRGRQIAYIIYEHFRATRAYEAVQGLSDLLNIRLQNDGVEDFDVRWDQAVLSASEIPTDVILEGLYKWKLQDSVQLQTSWLCLIKKLLDGNNAEKHRTEIYLRWKPWRMSETKRAIVFSRIPFEGKMDWRRETQSSQGSGNKEENSKDKSEIHADSNSVKIRHVDSGILLCVWITGLKKDVYMSTNAISDMLRQKESPTRSRRKVVRKDQLRYWRSLFNWFVYLKILIRENLFYVNREDWDRNTPSNSPKALGSK